MKRTLLSLVLGAAAASALLAGTAAASGPAAPGKRLVEVNCEGLGALTVSLAPSEHANGAGQVVGAKAHGIPVSNTFTITDVTKGGVLLHETESRSSGPAHQNQSSVACKSAPLEEEASKFFAGGPLPPGVAATDTIRVEFEVHIVPKK